MNYRYEIMFKKILSIEINIPNNLIIVHRMKIIQITLQEFQ